MAQITKEIAEEVIRICKRRGIIFPTAEIYGSVAGFFEYGPVGVLLKRKFENYWREYFIRSEENIVEIEGSLVLPDAVWDASGHLKSFVDPLTQCKSCKVMYRADNLIEEKAGRFVEGLSTEELTKILREESIKCPRCGGELTDTKLFNLLLKTQIGPVEGESASLRPETAQNMFINFKRVFSASRAKLPFGIAQVGRSFRNEISPRQFIVRLREFNQCEIEMFIDPQKINDCPKFDQVANVKITIYTREAQKSGGKPIELTAKEAVEKGVIPNKWMAYFMAKEFLWFQSLGIPKDALRFRHLLPEETPHYSKGNFDLEIEFDFGFKESVGNAYRSDYDLSRHMEYAKVDLSVLTEDGRKIIPHVIEPSFGVERPLLGILLHSFRKNGRGWAWFKLPAKIAPYLAGIFPLVNKNGLPEKAREVYGMLKKDFDVFYDDKGSIGKRYARADEIGCVIGVTIDYQTLKDDTVTLRDRDTTQQVRVPIKELKPVLQRILEGERFENLKEIFT